MTPAARLKALKLASGLTWAEFAELFASDTSTLTRWASGFAAMPGPAVKLMERLENDEGRVCAGPALGRGE